MYVYVKVLQSSCIFFINLKQFLFQEYCGFEIFQWNIIYLLLSLAMRFLYGTVLMNFKKIFRNLLFYITIEWIYESHSPKLIVDYFIFKFMILYKIISILYYTSETILIVKIIFLNKTIKYRFNFYEIIQRWIEPNLTMLFFAECVGLLFSSPSYIKRRTGTQKPYIKRKKYI